MVAACISESPSLGMAAYKINSYIEIMKNNNFEHQKSGGIISVIMSFLEVVYRSRTGRSLGNITESKEPNRSVVIDYDSPAYKPITTSSERSPSKKRTKLTYEQKRSYWNKAFVGVSLSAIYFMYVAEHDWIVFGVILPAYIIFCGFFVREPLNILIRLISKYKISLYNTRFFTMNKKRKFRLAVILSALWVFGWYFGFEMYISRNFYIYIQGYLIVGVLPVFLFWASVWFFSAKDENEESDK